ncbi:hypothetical protein [Arthrobacter sp. TMN-50]
MAQDHNLATQSIYQPCPENEDNFVIPFATKLRENGAEAWVDQ